MNQAAVFIDRDGVLCVDKNLVDIGMPGPDLLDEKDVKLYQNVIDGIKKLNEKNFKIIIITNQSKVGRGIITYGKMQAINSRVKELIENQGGKLDEFYVCTHTIEENCNCRKPKTGLLELAKKDFEINLQDSWIIGDKTVDIQTGKNAGCKTILVKTGYAGRDKKYNVEPNYVVENLMEAAKIIISSQNHKH